MTLGLRLKPGLHIELKLRQGSDRTGTLFDDQSWNLDLKDYRIEHYDGKSGLSPFLQQCAQRIANGWCINTNKCYDLPKKGAHSCSPYMVGFKRESLPDVPPEDPPKGYKAKGAKYTKDKPKLFARLQGYFANAYETLDENEHGRLHPFERFLRDESSVMNFLKTTEEFTQLSDKEYIIFYLDEPLEHYRAAHRRYLASRLFNTNDHNLDAPDNSGEVYGTPDFYTGYNVKKPYLLHQTATFDIQRRISSEDAVALYEFQQLMGRGIFPRPLVIFESNEEAEALNVQYGQIVQRAYLEDGRTSHREIIRRLGKTSNLAQANFLLLYYYGGQILDYGQVTRFEYELRNDRGLSWQIQDVMHEQTISKSGGALYQPIGDVFELEDVVLPVLFDNELVQVLRDKKGTVVGIKRRYFDELDAKYSKSAVLFQLVLDYRRAFYDYIYKSRRNAVTAELFRRVLMQSIRDGIRRDEIENGYHTQERYLLRKLNLLISLHGHFDGDFQKSTNMQETITAVPAHLERVLDNDDEKTVVHLENQKQFAYLAGQTLRYLFGKMNTDTVPHSQLDGYLNKRTTKDLTNALAKLFARYTHVKFSNRFATAMSELMAYGGDQDEPVDTTMLLAGYFRYVRQEDRLLNAPPKPDTDSTSN